MSFSILTRILLGNVDDYLCIQQDIQNKLAIICKFYNRIDCYHLIWVDIVYELGSWTLYEYQIKVKRKKVNMEHH